MLHHEKFRGDVEALRGLAVVLVVLFHLKLEFLPSGFIGVDIFFVISGYLMAVAFADPKQSIKDFYDRRARRVLPAALIIMVVCYIASPLFFLPFESAKMAEQALGMFFFVPNLVFWKIDDYFSALNFAPMLHYWSLGVELQYYFVFPLLVYFFKNNLKWFAALLIASLLLSLLITPIMSKTAFFMLPTRFWEFLFGFFAYHLGKVLLARGIWSDFGRNSFIVITAFLLILYAMYPIPKDQFPGFYAIPAVLLSFLIITIGVDNKYIENNFAIAILRWFGKLSYSIYLIHYPIIFLFIYQPFSEWKPLSITDCVLIIAITLALSVLSYRYIEVPFRNRNSISFGQFALLISVIYIIMAISVVLYERMNYFSETYPVQEARVFKAMEDVGNFRCSKIQRIKEYNDSSCYLVQNDGRSFYLVGDSHMDALKEAFVEVAEEHKASVRLNKARCFLGEGQCSYREIERQIKKHAISDVVLHGWAYEKFNYEDLQKLVDNATSLSVKIHFIGPIPTYSKSVPRALYKEITSEVDEIERISQEQFRGTVSEKYMSFMSRNRQVPSVFFYQPETYFCNEICLLEGKDGIYYYDEHHVTLTGAALLKPLFMEIMR